MVRQAAAIPVLGGQVCLVSSRSGKRWVVPKGCLEPGKTAREIALLEAWEEAGLVGILQPEPAGSYFYAKEARTHHVVVFLMQVTQIADDWPEAGWRERSWLNFPEALLHVEERGLRELLRGIGPAPVRLGAATV
jgi:8-oxo-dGTP pyrophosphatase MutT (NUDIX family)